MCSVIHSCFLLLESHRFRTCFVIGRVAFDSCDSHNQACLGAVHLLLLALLKCSVFVGKSCFGFCCSSRLPWAVGKKLWLFLYVMPFIFCVFRHLCSAFSSMLLAPWRKSTQQTSLVCLQIVTLAWCTESDLGKLCCIFWAPFPVIWYRCNHPVVASALK